MKKITLTIIFAVFLLCAIAVPAQPQTVGISEGDWFTYIGTYFHDADIGGSTVPNQLLPYQFWNDTDEITRTVVDITGTVITWETEYTFNNGTADRTLTLVEDITNPGNYTCIPANMEVGEVFYYDGTYAQADLTITEERTIDYGESTRPTNYHFTTTGAWATVGRQYWFDKATGILVKAVLDATYAGSDQNSTSGGSFELIECSEWVIPEFPTGTALLLVFVAVTVCVDIYRRKKLKH